MDLTSPRAVAAVACVLGGLLFASTAARATSAASPSPQPTATPTPAVNCNEFPGKLRQQCYEVKLQQLRLIHLWGIQDLDNKISVENLRLQIYGAQLQRAPAIQFLVIIIVLVGLALSVLQFLKSVWFAKGDLTPEQQKALGELKISPTGIELTSATIGVAILVISLAFFYLYLTNVYKITQL